MGTTMIIRNITDLAAAGECGGVPVHGAPATGETLFRTPELADDLYAGIDLLVVEPDAAFPIHTHAGHHMLYVVAGEGSVMYEGKVYPTRSGDFVVIEAEVIHNVAAGPSGQYLLAFGAPHRHVHAADRMTVVE